MDTEHLASNGKRITDMQKYSIVICNSTINIGFVCV